MTPDLALGRRFLQTHARDAPLLVGVTGAHYYGFPSRDSDFDLKGIHVAPTRAVVGLFPPPETHDYLGLFEGQEVDYTSHELALALRLLLKGNGNILERIFSPFQLLDSAEATELRELARGALSRRFYHHYRGFFGRMCDDCAKAQPRTAKGFLYAYRSALTGIHLLRTGECVGDASVLAPRYGFGRVAELLERKREGNELGELTDPTPYEADWPRLESALQLAFDGSRLPEQAPDTGLLSDFLVRQRERRFGKS